MKATFKDINILISEVFKFEKKLYVNLTKVDTTKSNSINHKIAELLILCDAYNVKFSRLDFLNILTERELETLKTYVTRYIGTSLFNIKRLYGLEEAIKTFLQYARDYGDWDIPRDLWDTKIKLKIEKPETETFIQVLSFYDYFSELEKIIESSKNPDSREIGYLYETRHLKTLECGIIPNRNVLGILAQRVDKFKFKAHTTSSLRSFIEGRPKLRTSDKTFIMYSLNKLKESEVLDDFATKRKFWKSVEKQIIPTQKRFNNCSLAQSYFYKLRNNDFKNSNNSKIENQQMNLVDKFKQMCELKSSNFAIRNVTKIAKRINFSGEEIQDLMGEIRKSNVSLKQLIELYRGLNHLTCEKNYVKIKGKFWGYKRQSDDSLGMLFGSIREEIQRKFIILTRQYMEDINSDTELAKKYRGFPDITISNNLLKGIAIPTSTDGFFDIDLSKHYITRGSEFEIARFLNPNNPYGVFVAWKAKDNKEYHMDIDLSCNAVSSKNEPVDFDTSFKYEVCNYTYLNGKGIKHSGDWTSCREFDPNNPTVVAEIITVDPQKVIDKQLNFMINCFNGVSIKNYDVYIGLIRKEDIKTDNYSNKSLINLDDAAFICGLGGDQNGYIKLFTIENGRILFEGTEISDKTFRNSMATIRENIVSSRYFSRFSDFDVYDLIEMLDFKSENHNPYKLNLFLNTVLNW